MTKVLALLAASAAFGLMASAANAQAASGYCTNGYLELPKHQIISCGTQALYGAPPAPVGTVAPRAAAPGMMVSDPSACRHGSYWMRTTIPDGDEGVPMPCP